MRIRNIACAVALAVPGVAVLATAPAGAHGAVDSPVSRSYVCYQEGPESPVSDVCAAVVAAGGTQPLYDWMEVNIGDAAGRHREIIPDGQLCSAGRAKYRGLDLARSDWPATSLPAGEGFTFRYRATAPHQGGFEFYVTRDGYDPTEPLAWDDLEPEPFHVEPSPQLVDGYYVMDVTLPDKQGRHLIYGIWQRTDSPEAFYSCSDVDVDSGSAIGGSGGGASESEDPGDTGDGSEADSPATCSAAEDSANSEHAANDTSDHDEVNTGGGAGEHGSGEHDGAEPDGADNRVSGRFSYWQAVIEWLSRLREWAQVSPRLADDAVLSSSVVPTAVAPSGAGGSSAAVALGVVATAMVIGLAVARPVGRGRYRWRPAHRS